MKVYLITVSERHGEFHHNTKCLIKASNMDQAEKLADTVACDWRGTTSIKNDFGFWEHYGGELWITAEVNQEVPPEDTEILYKYLNLVGVYTCS